MSTHNSILTQSNNDSQKHSNGAHNLTSESAAYLIQYALDNIDYPSTPDDHRAIQLGALAASHLLTGQPDASTFDPAELEQAIARLVALSNQPPPAPETTPEEKPALDSPIRTPVPAPDEFATLTGPDIMALALNGLLDHIDGCMPFGESVPTDLAESHPLRARLAILLEEAISRAESEQAEPKRCPICKSETIHADWEECYQERARKNARPASLEMGIDFGYATFVFNAPQIAGLITACKLAENATETIDDEAANAHFRTYALMFECALMAMTNAGYMMGGNSKEAEAENQSLMALFTNSANNVV